MIERTSIFPRLYLRRRGTFSCSRWSIMGILAAFWLGACTDNLPRRSEVEDLRVLAITMDPPEIVDADLPTEVQIQALVVDPRDGRQVEVAWGFCPFDAGRLCENFDGTLETLQEGAAGALGGSEDGGDGQTPPDPFTSLLTPLPDSCSAMASTYAPQLTQVLGLFGILSDLSYTRARYRDFSKVETIAADQEQVALTIGLGDGTGDVSMLSVDLSFLPNYYTDRAACDADFIPPAFDPEDLPKALTDLHLLGYVNNPFFAPLDSRPRVTLKARSFDGSGTEPSGLDEVYAMKRLSMGYRHPSAPTLFLKAMVPLAPVPSIFCAQGDGSLDAPGCVDMRVREANRNPVFSTLAYHEGGLVEGEGDDILLMDKNPSTNQLEWVFDGELEVAPGDKIRIVPSFTADSVQSYQTVHANLDDGSLFIQDEEEILSIDWFATAGRIAEQRTSERFSRVFSTAYTAPCAVPGSGADQGLVRIWMVARDQRGGSTFAGFDVRVLPYPEGQEEELQAECEGG